MCKYTVYICDAILSLQCTTTVIQSTCPRVPTIACVSMPPGGREGKQIYEALWENIQLFVELQRIAFADAIPSAKTKGNSLRAIFLKDGIWDGRILSMIGKWAVYRCRKSLGSASYIILYLNQTMSSFRKFKINLSFSSDLRWDLSTNKPTGVFCSMRIKENQIRIQTAHGCTRTENTKPWSNCPLVIVRQAAGGLAPAAPQVAPPRRTT